MNITRAATPLTRRGPADWFTGTVWLEDIGSNSTDLAVHCVRVAFEPGARTAWHTHPHGQRLLILSGMGRVQKAGEAAVDVQPGDSVWFEPGERHWHGAAPHSLMSHLAIHQADAAGNTVTWLEQVSDSEYNAV